MSLTSKIPLVMLMQIFCIAISTVWAQSTAPWTAKQLKDPQVLALTLQDPTAAKPAIFNIGPVEQIKGAVQIGPTNQKENLDRLRERLATIPKDKEVVIYCGCCPFSRCPNVRPAFELLKEMKFKNPKLLNLSTNLKEDWISKGYPLEQ